MTVSTASILAISTARGRDRRGDDEVVRVLARDGEPGEAAGELAGGHDQHRDDDDDRCRRSGRS